MRGTIINGRTVITRDLIKAGIAPGGEIKKKSHSKWGKVKYPETTRQKKKNK